MIDLKQMFQMKKLPRRVRPHPSCRNLMPIVLCVAALSVAALSVSCSGKMNSTPSFTGAALKNDDQAIAPAGPSAANPSESKTIPKAIELGIGQKDPSFELALDGANLRPIWIWTDKGLGFQAGQNQKEVRIFKRSENSKGKWEKAEALESFSRSNDMLIFASENEYWNISEAQKEVSFIKSTGNDQKAVSETKISIEIAGTFEALVASRNLLVLQAERSVYLLSKKPGQNKIYAFRISIPKEFERPAGFVLEEQNKLWLLYPGVAYFYFVNFNSEKLEAQTTSMSTDLLKEPTVKVFAKGSLKENKLQISTALVFTGSLVAPHLNPEPQAPSTDQPSGVDATALPYTQESWDTKVKPLSLKYCGDCHAAASTKNVPWKLADTFDGWKVNPNKIASKLKTGSMPPADAPESASFTESERKLLTGFAESAAK